MDVVAAWRTGSNADGDCFRARGAQVQSHCDSSDVTWVGRFVDAESINGDVRCIVRIGDRANAFVVAQFSHGDTRDECVELFVVLDQIIGDRRHVE